MSGRVTGLARRSERRAPMELLEAADISVSAGLAGDRKGTKFPRRQITILAEEDWDRALASLALSVQAAPWTTRRANILVSGLRLPRAAGASLQIGTATLEVTGQTYPCKRMEEAVPGLLKALAPEWRGGVTCRVVADGTVHLGSPAELLFSPPEFTRRLP